jgi:hypothetical protein
MGHREGEMRKGTLCHCTLSPGALRTPAGSGTCNINDVYHQGEALTSAHMPEGEKNRTPTMSRCEVRQLITFADTCIACLGDLYDADPSAFSSAIRGMDPDDTDVQIYTELKDTWRDVICYIRAHGVCCDLAFITTEEQLSGNVTKFDLIDLMNEIKHLLDQC